MLKPMTWLLSLAVHAAFAAWLFVVPGGAALDVGEGEDDFVVEQGIALEGIDTSGQDETTVQAVEAEPQEASVARPAIEEVKEQEKVEETPVIASETGPEQEVEEVKPEPVEQPLPPQVATIEQMEQIAVEEKRATTVVKAGGDATILSQYFGKLRSHIDRKKVNPRSRQVGTAVVRFTVHPSGHLLAREITRSSGNKMLDDAALASVDQAAPFPAMPADLGDEPQVVSVPFRFTVR